MNADEIHALSDADLDAAIAKGTGWRQGELDEWYSPSPDSPCFRTPLEYHFSLDACHIAEERLKEMGLGRAFVRALDEVAHALWMRHGAQGTGLPMRWYVAHAAARQRAEAILLAVQEGGE